MGDGAIVIFYTASEAINCAMAIQKEVQTKEDFKLSMGIHVSEILFTEKDIFGDGVNVASRIASLAEANEMTSDEIVTAIFDQVEVPYLSGPAADAEGTLTAAGLTGSSSEAFSDSVAAGDLISQDPTAGSEVAIDSAVSYVVSLGVHMVEVPDLSGAAADTAAGVGE